MVREILKAYSEYQSQYVDGILLPNITQATGLPCDSRLQAIDILQSPEAGLKFAVYNFAFARAGAERAGYGIVARDMVESEFPKSDPDPWGVFVALCSKRGIKPNEKVNRRPIEGLWRSTTEGLFGAPGIFAGIAMNIESTGGLASTYLRLRDKGGLGEKIACFLLRDLVWIWDLENDIHEPDLVFLQPIDVWLREAARLITELDLPEKWAHNYVVAHLLSEACRNSRVSGVAVNQGAWYVGAKKVIDRSKYQERIPKYVDLS
jgi:hypothetical protein